jgi:Ca-activated chloride channel family protein
MTFAHPIYLWLLLLIPLAAAYYIYRLKHRAEATLQIPSVAPLAQLPRSYKEYLRHVNYALLLGAVALLIIVLARPQSTDSWSKSNTEGIDIVLSLDVSYSMLIPDFKPNRVEAAKDVAAHFVAGRPNDNIGMVIFGKESYTMCPMTSDHAVLSNLLQSVSTELIDGSSTAIGDGLVTAVNRIKDGQAKSKTIILLTDGTNNAGDVAPRNAAEVAKTLGIRLYTIGVGSRGDVEMVVGTDPFGRPVKQTVKADIDEETLKDMAQITGGRYFRATDKETLSAIFDEIDRMEKTKMSVREFSRKEELYFPYALAALLLLLIHSALRLTLLRHIP